jgi:tryptophan-rich sensory protein
MHPFLVALAICFVAIVSEAIAAGTNPSACLRALRQPSWAPPTWLWYLIGFLYYGACLISLTLVLGQDPSVAVRWQALQLLITVMILNAAWNMVFFRLRALAVSVLLFVPYAVLVCLTVYVLYLVDREAAVPFIPYLFYLPYACVWAFAVWRMNRPVQAIPAHGATTK